MLSFDLMDTSKCSLMSVRTVTHDSLTESLLVQTFNARITAGNSVLTESAPMCRHLARMPHCRLPAVIGFCPKLQIPVIGSHRESSGVIFDPAESLPFPAGTSDFSISACQRFSFLVLPTPLYIFPVAPAAATIISRPPNNPKVRLKKYKKV